MLGFRPYNKQIQNVPRHTIESDPLRTDPTDVARRDHLEYFVERIISFTGDIRKASTLMFLVKWDNSFYEVF